MRNMCEILDKIENRGIAKGNAEVKEQMADLMKILLTENRIEDAKRAAEDPAYCQVYLGRNTIQNICIGTLPAHWILSLLRRLD